MQNETAIKTSAEKRFRISAKHMHLTYSRLPDEITFEDIKNELHRILPNKILHYIIAFEKHKDGAKHSHVYLEGKTKFNILSPTVLDIQYQNNTYHGSYTRVKKKDQIIAYVCKEKDYKTNMPKVFQGKLENFLEHVHRVAPEMSSEEDFLDYCHEVFPAKTFKSTAALTKLFQSKKRIKAKKEKLNQYEEQLPEDVTTRDFNWTKEITQWVKNGFQPTLILVGESAVGKSLWAKLLAREQGWNTLLLNQVEGMKELRPEHDAILFDDFDFAGISSSQLFAIIETQVPRTVRRLYGDTKKNNNIKQIITINPESMKPLKKILKSDRNLRRCQLAYVPKTFMGNILLQLNSNIINNNNNWTQVQQHTNIYNNPQNI